MSSFITKPLFDKQIIQYPDTIATMSGSTQILQRLILGVSGATISHEEDRIVVSKDSGNTYYYIPYIIDNHISPTSGMVLTYSANGISYWETNSGGGGGGTGNITDINSITAGSITISAGTNVTIDNDIANGIITINSSGGGISNFTDINGITGGSLTISAGTNVTIDNDIANGIITINSSGGGGGGGTGNITDINGITGGSIAISGINTTAVTIGNNITIIGANDINNINGLTSGTINVSGGTNITSTTIGNTILLSQIDQSGLLISAITANTSVGGNIFSGTSFSANTSLDFIFRNLLIKENTFINPTIEIDEVFPYVRVVGTVDDLSTTSYFNRNDAGSIISHIIRENNTDVQTGTTSALTYTNTTFTATTGFTTWYSIVSYNSGDSKTSLIDPTITLNNPITASTITSATIYLEGIYPFFYGMSNNATFSNGTALYNALKQLPYKQSNKLCPMSGSSAYIHFAYPSIYPLLYRIEDDDGINRFSSFTSYTINVTSVGLSPDWTVNYRVYSSTGTTTLSVQNYYFRFD